MTSSSDGWDRMRSALSGVTAAVLTPFDAQGRVRPEEVSGYARAMAGAGVSALAVAAHTGRGPHLSAEVRVDLVREFRSASGLPVVAGVGVPAGVVVRDESELGDIVVEQAQQVASAGAEALLCFPPPRLRHDLGHGDVVLALHERLVADTGLPVVAFAFYGEATSHAYSSEVVADLGSMRGVVAIKVAMLTDAITTQDLISQLRSRVGGALALTGEDRMFGPSLMWGAQGALVGLAAARAEWTVAVNAAWRENRHADFVSSSIRLDRLAALVFRAPMEGYVQRMTWVAEWEGLLPGGVCTDPFGPRFDPGEKMAFLRELDDVAARQAVP